MIAFLLEGVWLARAGLRSARCLRLLEDAGEWVDNLPRDP